MGGSVIVNNLRPGLDWAKAIVISKLVPLSYLMETKDKLLWRRHVNLLKRLESKPSCVSETLETRVYYVSETPDTDDPDDDVVSTYFTYCTQYHS